MGLEFQGVQVAREGGRIEASVRPALFLAVALLALIAPRGALTGAASLGALALTLPRARGMARAMGWGLLAAGLGLQGWRAWGGGYSLSDFLVASAEMSRLLGFLVLVQTLAVPIARGGYRQAIASLLDDPRITPPRFYAGAIIASFGLGSWLAIGSAPVIHHILRSGAQRLGGCRDRFLATAASRGVGIAPLWSPLSGLFPLALELSGLRWLELAPYTLPVAFGGLALAVAWEAPHLRRAPILPIPSAGPGMAFPSAWRRLRSLALVFCLLLAGVVAVEQATGRPTLTVVSCLAPLCALLWQWRLQGAGGLPSGWRQFWGQELRAMNAQFALFVPAGLFSVGLSGSGLGEVVLGWLGEWGGGGAIAQVFGLAAFVLGFGLLGVHPLVSAVVMGGLLRGSAAAWGLQPLQVAAGLLAGGILSYILSPLGAINLSMAGLLRRSSLEVAAWNWGFGPVYAILLLAAAAAAATWG